MRFRRDVDQPDCWLDLVDAAERAGVPRHELVAAVASLELRAIDSHPHRPGEWLVRVTDLERWLRQRAPIGSAITD